MSNKELSLQKNMFTDEWDDNRTRRQKKLDGKRNQPRQTEMFSSREIAQFGVRKTAWPLSPTTKLGLIFEDPRTPEEIERDRQRAAEEQTYPMFGLHGQDVPEQDFEQVTIAPDTVAVDDLVPGHVVDVDVSDRTLPVVEAVPKEDYDMV